MASRVQSNKAIILFCNVCFVNGIMRLNSLVGAQNLDHDYDFVLGFLNKTKISQICHEVLNVLSCFLFGKSIDLKSRLLTNLVNIKFRIFWY